MPPSPAGAGAADTETVRTDRQTDGQTDRFAISISRVSMLTRDKNLKLQMPLCIPLKDKTEMIRD